MVVLMRDTYLNETLTLITNFDLIHVLGKIKGIPLHITLIHPDWSLLCAHIIKVLLS